MKKLAQPLLYSTLALLLAAIPATLLAGHGPGHGPRFGHGPGDRLGGGFMAEMIAERLDLSSEQRDQIRDIRESYRDQTEALMDSVRAARLELHDSIHAELFDESAVRAAAARVGEVEADLAVVRAQIANDIRQVLTPEQVAEALELRERMRDSTDGRRGHHGRGRGGYGGPAAQDD